METGERVVADYELVHLARALEVGVLELLIDRKSTRLNSSH